jgi:hypothetical protein
VVNTSHRPKEEKTAGAPPIVNKPHECMDDDQQQIELHELYSERSKWTPEEKMQAVHAYFLTGDSKKAERHLAKMNLNIPSATIRWWKMQASWWDDTYQMVKKSESDKIIAALHEAQELAIGAVIRGLEEGDEVITKDGDIRNKRVSARDAATIAGIMTDKKQLIAGDPTSRSSSSNVDKVEALAKQMADFSRKMQDSGNLAKPIEGERVDEK